jgi:hypothetical protein
MNGHRALRRPGEKLCEELSTLLEDTVPTAHEKIRTYVGSGIPAGDMLGWLNELRDICAGDPDSIKALDDLWDLVLYYYELFDKLGSLADRVLQPGGSLLVAVDKARLPETLKALGEHLTERFLEAKREEVVQFNREVTEWEIRNYLGRY